VGESQDRKKLWIAVGLALATHPGRRDLFSVVELNGINDLGAVVPRLLENPLLRPQGDRAIFSGNFPDWADKEIQTARQKRVALLTYEEAAYPGRLRRLPDPPLLLYVKGAIQPHAADEGVYVAVVGSRRATPYGLRAAQRIAHDLAVRGVTIVSGLARGIDAAAHEGALEAGGRTIGVLGCGVDVVYPREHRKLYDRVADSGALVSEYPFGMGPQPRHFPVRNRIIAGLSDGAVVVEAARDSGSLITAALAADSAGLPVGAVPGRILSETSAGCNDLIYDGATPVRGAEDVIGMLDWGPRNRVAPPGPSQPNTGGRARDAIRALDATARRVLLALAHDEPASAEDLAARLGMPASDLLGRLLELELLELAVALPGRRYLRKS